MMKTKKTTLTALLAAAAVAACSACNLQLNTEYPDPAAEQEAFQKMRTVVGNYQQGEVGKGIEALRFFHAKDHGCAAGTLTVRSDIDPSLRHGVFSTPGATFDVVTRFSNGLSDVNPDSTPDTRGFAMQVLNVPGQRLLPSDTSSVATFIAAAYPSFLFSDAATIGDQMEIFSRTGVAGAAAKAAFLAAHPLTALAIAKTLLMGKDVLSPLGATYWSQTSYRLGQNQAIKFKFQPCLGENVPDLGKSGANYLRESLNLMLNTDQESACFTMFVQKQEDACEQPIEDAMVEWETDWWAVADIRFSPNQNLDGPQARVACENSFNSPWRNTVDHRPLGINRVRQYIYEYSSGNRHALNGQSVHEWTA